MTPRELISTLIEAIGNRGELDRIPDVFAEGWLDHSVWSNPIGADGVAVGAAPISTSLEETRQNIELMRMRFPDLLTKIDHVLEQPDHVVVVSTSVGTHRSGRRITHRGIEIHRLEGGKIVESWNAWDRLGLAQQLGLVPPTEELFAREVAL
jgi:ketosteroid isomerase-like protein